MDGTKEVDVAIIGAGISGLVAANELRKFSNGSIQVVVLEAMDRVGGRVFSTKLPAANGEDYWDMGGQWVSNTQKHVLNLLEEFHCDVFPQYSTGKKTLMVNNLADVRSYSGLIPKFGILELIDLDMLLKKITKLVKQIPLDKPLQSAYAREWDSKTLQSFVADNCRFAVCQDVMKAATRAVFGIEPSQISLFYFLYYCSQADGLEMLVETRNGAAQELRVKGSIGQLPAKIQEKIGTDHIICGDPVVAIDQCHQSSVVLKTEKGCKYNAKYVICAIPPRLVNKILFNPRLPLNRLQLGERMPVGNMIKCVATFDKDFWRAKGCSAESTAVVNENCAGPLCATFDATSSNGAPAILGLIAGEHAVVWRQKTKTERKDAFIECVAGMFGEEAKTSLIHYHEKDWSEERFIGGCPVSVMQPGCLAYFHHALHEPFDRVHWAGTETAKRWTGYMDGAVEAGQRAAKEISRRIKSPSLYPPSKLEEPSTVLVRTNTWSASNGKEKRSFVRSHIPHMLVLAALCGAAFYCYKCGTSSKST